MSGRLSAPPPRMNTSIAPLHAIPPASRPAGEADRGGVDRQPVRGRPVGFGHRGRGSPEPRCRRARKRPLLLPRRPRRCPPTLCRRPRQSRRPPCPRRRRRRCRLTFPWSSPRSIPACRRRLPRLPCPTPHLRSQSCSRSCKWSVLAPRSTLRRRSSTKWRRSRPGCRRSWTPPAAIATRSARRSPMRQPLPTCKEVSIRSATAPRSRVRRRQSRSSRPGCSPAAQSTTRTTSWWRRKRGCGLRTPRPRPRPAAVEPSPLGP